MKQVESLAFFQPAWVSHLITSLRVHMRFAKCIFNQTNVLRLYFFIFSIVCFISSCRQRYDTYENSLGIHPALLAQIDTPNFTIIKWKDSVKSFGVVTEGDSIKIDFHFENIGETPLFLLAVKPSCGCTKVDYPRNTILPGEKGKITAIFTTSGQPPGMSVKSIIIKANTRNSMHHAMVFRGEIRKRST